MDCLCYQPGKAPKYSIILNHPQGFVSAGQSFEYQFDFFGLVAVDAEPCSDWGAVLEVELTEDDGLIKNLLVKEGDDRYKESGLF
jgi:hypothetical protein